MTPLYISAHKNVNIVFFKTCYPYSASLGFGLGTLNRHNALRGKVARGEERAQAQAANMKKLVGNIVV